jgi:hypothetical protein
MAEAENNPVETGRTPQEEPVNIHGSEQLDASLNEQSSSELEETQISEDKSQSQERERATAESEEEWTSLTKFRLFPVTASSESSEETEDPARSQPTGETAGIETSKQPSTILGDQPSSEPGDIQSPSNLISSQKTGATASSAGREWTSFASFRLEFQTRETAMGRYEQQVIVHHIGKKQEKAWSRLNDESIYAWILDQVEGLEEGASEEQTTTLQPVIRITQIRFLQPTAVIGGMLVDTEHATPSSALRSNEALALEVTFKLL